MAEYDTLTRIMEWTMSHLLEESGMSKLPYLQEIIFETICLAPATPMLLPHYAPNDGTIYGYDGQRGTMVLVNTWACPGYGMAQRVMCLTFAALIQSFEWERPCVELVPLSTSFFNKTRCFLLSSTFLVFAMPPHIIQDFFYHVLSTNFYSKALKIIYLTNLITF